MLQHKDNAEYAINAHFNNDAGHHTRNVGRCRRVCFRQPGMQWNEPCLYAKPHKKKEKQPKV